MDMKNIRLNAICPGFVETDLTAAVIGQAPDPAAVRRERTAAHPIGRLGRPEDIASMAVYLVSDESSRVTRAVLPVDGGYLACDNPSHQVAGGNRRLGMDP